MNNIFGALPVVAASALAVMSAHSAGTADEIKAIQAEIKSNSVTRGSVRCRYYLAYYRELCTESEREAILERNIAAHRRWIAIAGKDGVDPKGAAMPRAELGKVLVIGGRWDEAEKELSEALKYAFDKNGAAEARWALAECLWHRGDKDGAKKQIAEIVAMDGPKHGHTTWERARFMHRAWTDPDGDIDELKLPHAVDCKPFPVPREAKYGERKVSLARVEIDMRDAGGARDESRNQSRVSLDSQAPRVDPIVRLLKRKLTRFGSTFAPGGTKISIEISPAAPVDKPQGYTLDVAKGKISIKARDRLGATWGAVSLIQCVDRGDVSVLECSIRDWPKLERRGVIEARWKADFLEYALFHKMSSLVVKFGRPTCDFLFSELERERIRIGIARGNDFGIETYWSARELSVHPPLPLSADRTRELHLRWFRWAAEFGGNVCFEMDDERFREGGLPEVDKKAFGTATNMDSKYLTGLYRATKKEFPKFRMIFGTPFYFGPDGACGKDWYPEAREPYLRSHKEFLDPEIDVYWSGPRVKSAGFTVAKIQWMTDLIGRKPVVYHNSDCVWRHHHDQYGADVPGFKASHCPETLDMIGGLYVNMTHYRETCKIGPAMDWSWNPDAHDAKEATRRTVEQLEGPGVFEILAEATPQISYLDKYPFGTPRSELMTEDPEKLDKIVADGEDAWRRVRALAKNGGMMVGGFADLALRYCKKLANCRRNPSKAILAKLEAEKANTSYAKAEVGFDMSKGDMFLPAGLLQGGHWYNGIRDDTGRAPCGVKELTVGDTISGNFTLDLFPPEGIPKLTAVGIAFVEAWDKDFKIEMPEIELSVNGKTVWSGKMFADGVFKPCEIPLPVSLLLRNNTFSIKYLGPDIEHKRRPMLHYVVIKP